MPAQVSRFALVGLAATLVHVLCGTLLIHAGTVPLLANIAAFGAAFLVSFCGHDRLTFQGHGQPLSHALPRFALTATAGFAVNEASLGALLALTSLPPAVALALATGGGAVLGFLLSRGWVFRRGTPSLPRVTAG